MTSQIERLRIALSKPKIAMLVALMAFEFTVMVIISTLALKGEDVAIMVPGSIIRTGVFVALGIVARRRVQWAWWTIVAIESITTIGAVVLTFIVALSTPMPFKAVVFVGIYGGIPLALCAAMTYMGTGARWARGW